MTKRTEDHDAERRREALKRVMEQRNLTPASLARRAGMVNPNLIYNFLNGHSKSLSHKTIEDFVKVLPGLVYEDFIDPDRELGEQPPTSDTNFAYLKGKVEAGDFRENHEYPPHQQRPVAIPSAVRLPAAMYALEVKDKDGLYKKNTVLFCMPFKQYTKKLKDDRPVIVHRYRYSDGTVETTVRVYRAVKGGPYLEDEKGNKIDFPADYNGGLIELNGDWMELAAIVISYYTQEED